MRIKFQTFLYCLLFCVTLCEESTVRIGRGFRTPIYSLRTRGNEDLPNPWLHPRTCGDDYSNNTVICDPDEGLSVEFKSRFNKWSSMSNYRIFLAIIGNLDYNNVGRVFEGDDISTKYYADHLTKKWNQEFAAVASNITVDVLIFAWLNDDANLFDIATRHKHSSSSTLDGVVYDMNWLNYQQFWWFGGVSRMSAIEQALTCGVVQTDMYISNGVSHLNSPYSHWYKNSVKPSSDWYYFTLYWLYFFGLIFLDTCLQMLEFIIVSVLGELTVSAFKNCSKTLTVPQLIETLKLRTATPNYYVRVYKSEYCAICREKLVQLPFLSDNNTNSRGANSASGCNGNSRATTSSVTPTVATPPQITLSTTSSGPTEEVVLCVDPVILSCGHIFGCACITQSFLSVAGLKCPICQKPALHDENRNALSTTVATLVMRVDAEEAV